ncbi:MAG: hypothetical protein WAV81_01240, partial [Candidatus Competibacter sp.]
ALRCAVAKWEHRLSRLLVTGRAVTRPPEVWDRFQRRLFPASPRQIVVGQPKFVARPSDGNCGGCGGLDAALNAAGRRGRLCSRQH